MVRPEERRVEEEREGRLDRSGKVLEAERAGSLERRGRRVACGKQEKNGRLEEREFWLEKRDLG